MHSHTYSPFEEKLNSLSHAIGLLLALAGAALLLAESQHWLEFTSVAIYGASLVLMFLASTLYHAAKTIHIKQKLKLFDHSAIYVLIAGTYTPLMLLSLNGGWRLVGISLIWSLALVGVIHKLSFHHRFPKLSLTTYLLMGWLALIFLYPLSKNIAAAGLWLMGLGGVVFSVGVLFYVQKQKPYTHAIWHLFVIGGCLCHYLAIYFYVI